ncbi:vWA domain-containing protein [Lamprocystis purpurea]|jgi:predicted metal-dependent peptidase|uniref:vWA domain-containing protein n=1 Tax=Lamprocystis purpurea TaxID=61598 RepID=UPI00037BD8F9|nr:VWA-like domain-containing protein [Lamprocystis purpurea]
MHIHRGTRAIQRLVEYAPSSGGLALWVKHLDRDDVPDTLAAANDGTAIFYGPLFVTLPLTQQAGLVAHEVLHVALRHRQRYVALRGLLGDVDLQLFNCCADAIVNSALGHLTWLELPPGAVGLDSILDTALGLREPVEKSLLEWDLERLYRAIDDRRLPQVSGPAASRMPSKSGKAGAGAQHQGPSDSHEQEQEDATAGRWTTRFDGPRAARVRGLASRIQEDLWPGADESRPEAEMEEAREWGQRLARAHTGDGTFSLLRVLLADLPKVRTPWEHVLRTHLTRGLSLQPGLSWSRPSRSYLANQGRVGTRGRMPWEPGRVSARAVARLVVMVDLSGSIDAPLLDRFARELQAVTRRLEARVIVILGDDRVTGVEIYEPGRFNLPDLVFDGGGGTDFTPLLREADRHRPDLGLFLTDLDGPADFRPRWPVIWAVPVASEQAEAPFGRKLVLG